MPEEEKPAPPCHVALWLWKPEGGTKYVQELLVDPWAEGKRYQALCLSIHQPANLSGGFLEALKAIKVLQRTCGDIRHCLCPLGTPSLARRKIR